MTKVDPSPASPAGDLISLSAGATPGTWSDAVLMGESANRKLASALVNAFRSGRLVEAAPAAPRKGPSEEEIARIVDPISWENWDEIRPSHYGSYSLSGEPEGRLNDQTCARWRHADFSGGLSKSLAKARAIAALLTPADRGETQAVGDGWQPISTAPKDGQLIGVAGGCAYWDVVRKCWCSAVSSDYGRPLQWEPTHWKNLDYTTLPSPSPDQNRGEPDQGGEVR